MSPNIDIRIEGVTDTQSVTVPDPTTTNGETRARFTIDDVLPHRANSKPLPKTVAGFGSASLYKSLGSLKRPKAKRFDHHISESSRSRQPSSLKGAMRYFTPEMISLCGGLPSSEYFPFEELSIKVPTPPHFTEQETSESGVTLTAGKYDVAQDKSALDLRTTLNYGQAMGPPPLLRFVVEHTEVVHDPPYSDWDVAMTAGSTSALEMCFHMLAERGDFIMTEEYSFSSAIETARPMGLRMLGIPMEEEGMRPDELDKVLSEWDESARIARKPSLVYTVPTGQNPTAASQSAQRRKDLYAVAEKHDLILLEDEPYYFLQMEDYIQGKTQEMQTPFRPAPIADFLSTLIPSLLSLDTSGRVIRLDSFSKIIAPGSRCGWITGPEQLIERFIRHQELTVQNAGGFSTIALFKLLDEQWGHKGFLEWLMYIRAEYTWRRDTIVNACFEYLPQEVASWIAPKAGMFHWIKLDLEKHPQYSATKAQEGKGLEQLLAIEHSIFLNAVKKNVLLAKGSFFRAEKGTDTELFIRMTFAAVNGEQMTEAVRRVGIALREEYGLAVQNGH